MTDLQLRAKAFLQRPLPPGFGTFAPDNITDMMIARYADGDPFESEHRESLDLCRTVANQDADKNIGDIKAFFAESASILHAIRADLTKTSV